MTQHRTLNNEARNVLVKMKPGKSAVRNGRQYGPGELFRVREWEAAQLVENGEAVRA